MSYRWKLIYYNIFQNTFKVNQMVIIIIEPGGNKAIEIQSLLSLLLLLLLVVVSIVDGASSTFLFFLFRSFALIERVRFVVVPRREALLFVVVELRCSNEPPANT